MARLGRAGAVLRRRRGGSAGRLSLDRTVAAPAEVGAVVPLRPAGRGSGPGRHPARQGGAGPAPRPQRDSALHRGPVPPRGRGRAAGHARAQGGPEGAAASGGVGHSGQGPGRAISARPVRAFRRPVPASVAAATISAAAGRASRSRRALARSAAEIGPDDRGRPGHARPVSLHRAGGRGPGPRRGR
ncbi:hypothetical protein D3C80_1288190 [compost metagenome]